MVETPRDPRPPRARAVLPCLTRVASTNATHCEKLVALAGSRAVVANPSGC